MKPNAVGKQISLNEGKFPFHYGGEAEQYTFYRIPKLLFSDPILRGLSTDAKVLYGLMLDRMSLSLKNGWLDEYGRVFIYFSVEHIMELLDCGNGKCTKLLSELDDQNGIGLITRVRQGQGKPDLIYVHKCVSEISKSHFKRCENRISEDSITNYYGKIYDSVNGCFPTIGALIASVGLFSIVKNIRVNNEKIIKIITFLGSRVLYTYLFHTIFIRKIIWKYFMTSDSYNFVVVLLVSVMVYTLSMLVGVVLEKIPLVKNLVKI